MDDDNALLEGVQRRRITALALAGAALTIALLIARFSAPRVRELATRKAPPAASAWPVIDPASESRAPDLPVRGFAERGSLRIETPRTVDQPVLVLVSTDFGTPRLVERRPDFGADGLLEFYGQTAGIRHGFLRSRDLVSELFEANVERGRMAVVHVGVLSPARTRSLELRRDGRAVETRATVLLQYGAFEVVHDWTGAPLELATPLANPQAVTVAPARRSDGALELGLSRRVEGGDEPIVIDLEHGDARLTLASAAAGDGDSGALDADEFRFTLTPDTDVATGRELVVSRLLACVREDEFSIPPRIHTWSSAPEGERAPAICGLGAGRFRVAAGIERQGRYTLWRPREVRDDESVDLCVAALESQAQTPPPGAVLLPPWIRTFPAPDASGAPLVSARERSLHPQGPGEVWEETLGAVFTLRRRVGWRDATGDVLPLRASDFVLALPEGAASRARELRLRVTPGLDARLSSAWEYRATSAAGIAGPFPPAPDGRLEGVLVLEGGETWTCTGSLEHGKWSAAAPRWSRSGDRAEPAAVEALASHGELAPAAASFTKPVQMDLWTRERLGCALGLDLQAFDLATLGLVGQPGGEIVRIERNAAPFALPRGDLIEVQAQDAGRSLWGFFPARAAVGPQAERHARIAILDRAGRRTLHLTFPHAELRLDLAPGEMRELVVVAPVEVFLLSIVSGAREQEKAAEEGLGVELRADDVLVAEYD